MNHREYDFISPVLPEINKNVLLFRELVMCGSILSGIAHMAFCVLFYIDGVNILAAFNLFSIMCYAVTFMLVKRHHVTAGLMVITAEVALHAVLATVMVGWESSFYIYIILVLPLVILNRLDWWPCKMPVVILMIAIYMWLDIRYRGAAPPYLLNPAAVAFLCRFNVLTFMAFLVVMTAMHLRLSLQGEQVLQDLVVTDPLTGLKNRRSIMEISASETSRQRRYGRPLSFVMCDLDHFKNINDSFGHECGDEVIRSVARVLVKGVRDLDHAIRWGGEEFLLLLPETPIQSAKQVADRLRAKIESLNIPGRNESISVTMTFGLSILHNDERMEEAIDRADLALYEGKRAGRNRVELAHEDRRNHKLECQNIQ